MASGRCRPGDPGLGLQLILSHLWSQTAAALEGYGLAGHVVGVFAGEEDAYAADVVC